jgi:hypothetical protein
MDHCGRQDEKEEEMSLKPKLRASMMKLIDYSYPKKEPVRAFPSSPLPAFRRAVG